MARKFAIIEGISRTRREGLLLYDEAVRAAGDKRLATRAEMVAYLSYKNHAPPVRQWRPLGARVGRAQPVGVRRLKDQGVARQDFLRHAQGRKAGLGRH